MKLNKLIICAAAALAMVSCDLDKYPYSEVAAEGYVKGDASLNNLVVGCYNSLHGVMYYEWALTELRSDNARMYLNNSTSSQTKLVEQLDQSVVGAEHAWVSEYWNASYATIARCNNVISYLDKAETAEKRALYEGEALFLRSLQYFNLVRLWGPVFMVTKPVSNEQARTMQRSSVEDIYGLIEGDLSRIIDGKMLPEQRVDAELGRADMVAAKALLAKVYATHYSLGDEKYAKAAQLCLEVLRSQRVGNPMTAADMVPYADVFSTRNEMNREIIFAVRYTGGKIGLGSPFGQLFAPTNNGANVIMGSCMSYNYPPDNLIVLYNQNPTDKRKDVNLAEGYFNATTGQWVEKNGRHVRKYLNADQASNPVTSQNDGSTDWPVIRVADIALLYAELVNELSGPTAEALGYLNMVRERAGVAAYSQAELAGRYEFRNAVRNERRLELAFENQRWFDLMRWGVARETVNKYLASESFYAGYSYSVNPLNEWQTYLPIPIDVININPNVAQNIGY